MQNLINDNIIETDQIIDKILNKKIEQNENNNDVIQTIKQNEINDIAQENNQNENDNVIEIVEQSKIDNVAQTVEQNEESNQIQSTMQNQIVNEAQCVEQKEIDSAIQSKSQSEVNNIIKYANEDEQCDEIKYADETENSYSKMKNKIEQQGEDSNSLENIEFANEDVHQNQGENTQLITQKNNDVDYIQLSEIDEEEYISVFKRLWMKVTKLFKLKSENENNIN